MLKFNPDTYTDFATIMGLEGTLTLSHFDRSIFATQDLTRMLQNRRVKRTTYHFVTTPAADEETALQWADASDWNSVLVNGVVQTDDGELPQTTDERIITAVTLQISGTTANWSSAFAARLMPNVSVFMLLRSWETLITGHQPVNSIGPNTLPQWLVPGEETMHYRTEVSGGGVQNDLMVQMVSAEPGVLSPFQGV